MSKVRVKSTLPKFLNDTEKRAGRAVTKCSILIASNASVKTPIDTSVLLNSQYRLVYKQGTAIIGGIGYTAEYAPFVHSKAYPQNFRRATAEKEFLKNGGDEIAATIYATIKAEMAV